MKKLLVALLLVSIAGCQSVDEVGLLYRVERAYWQAGRSLAALEANRASTPADAEKVRDQYMAVVKAAESGTQNAGVRRVAGQSLLQSYDLLQAEKRKDEAGRVLDKIFSSYAADSVVAGEALWRRSNRANAAGDSTAALEDMRRVVAMVRPSLTGTRGVSAHVMEIPIELTRFRLRRGDKEAAAREAATALGYYYGIAAQRGTREAFAARAYVADVLRSMNRSREALGVMDSLLNDSRKIPEEASRRPELYLRAVAVAADEVGDLEQANRYLDGLFRDYPKSPLRGSGELMRGRLLARLHRNEDAAKTFSLVARDATLPEGTRAAALIESGRLAELENNWEEAQRSYRDAATNYPLTPQGMQAPLYQIAHYQRIKDDSGLRSARLEARKVFEGTLARYPDSPVSLRARELLLACLIDLQDWQAAASRLADLADSQAGSRTGLQALLALAQMHDKKLSDPKAAIADYRKILARYPGVPFKAKIEAEIKRLGG